jgi:capsular polysaccharide transport system permease protein
VIDRKNREVTLAVHLSNTETFDLWSAVERQRRVLFALMLRNVRTRFFGHGLGYVLYIAWPLSHILIIVVIFVAAGRSAPYGDSVALFVATGALPFMIFSYLSRFMMISVFMARPLLAFPEVKIFDILVASALLETLAACCVTITLIVIAWFFGIDVMPINIIQAAYALGAALLLGLGFGFLNGVIALALPFWITVYSLSIIAFWISAGIFFVPDALPETFRSALAWHPVLQTVEWMRSAYYEGYGDLVLDRRYTIGVGIGAVFLGLLLERAMRGHLLAQR